MATAVFYADGEAVDYTPNADIAAGDVVDLGDFVGIAVTAIASGTLGALQVEGVYYAPKKTGETWTLGQPLFWDVGTTSFTNGVSYSEAAAGLAWAAAASGDAKGYVRLCPGVARS